VDKYIREATKYTPLIELHPRDQYLLIRGDSYPENALETYEPLLLKLEEYFQQHGNLRIDFLIDFLNTSSSKMMTELIAVLQRYHEKGNKIDLKWYYPDGDTELKESWEMLLEDATFPYSVCELTDWI